MNLAQLRSLVAVADAGSFTAAAEEMGVTQSGVSQAVATLEESLGMPVITRLRNGIELTAFGEHVVDHARAVLESLARIRRAADSARGESGGVIRLAGFPSVFASFLPSVLRRFRNRHPDIHLTVLETDDHEVETWLTSGAVDLGIVLNPRPERKAVILGRDAWIPVFPAAHRFARRSAVSLEELAAEPFILATGGCDINARTLAETSGTTLSSVQIEVRDWTSAIALVQEGAGVSLVPESTLPETRRGLRMGTLKKPLFRTFGLVASPAKTVSRGARLFLECAKPVQP